MLMMSTDSTDRADNLCIVSPFAKGKKDSRRVFPA
jgi:hypothetical protein